MTPDRETLAAAVAERFCEIRGRRRCVDWACVPAPAVGGDGEPGGDGIEPTPIGLPDDVRERIEDLWARIDVHGLKPDEAISGVYFTPTYGAGFSTDLSDVLVADDRAKAAAAPGGEGLDREALATALRPVFRGHMREGAYRCTCGFDAHGRSGSFTEHYVRVVLAALAPLLTGGGR